MNRRVDECQSGEEPGLEQIVKRFELAWQRGQRPDIGDYLPPEQHGRRAVLIELVHTDLEYRLKGGELAPVESHFERFPELAHDRKTALDLIAAEFELRRRQEPRLSVEEYLVRFPDYGDELAARLAKPVAPRPCKVVTWDYSQSVNPSARDDVSGRASPASPLLAKAFGRDHESAEAGAKELPARIGRYEVLEVVGRGAFGVVYRARDRELDRTVAIKTPRSGRLTSSAERDRFLSEARRAAQLRHSGIVVTHDIGEESGQVYIVSEFVEGTTLAQRIKRGRLSHLDVGLLVARVAEAVHHAHLHGVIHRDIKPGNILLDMRGQPHVADFGLAVEEHEMPRESRAQIGTPPYMSPEQVRGEWHRIDTRTDIYSLGVVLYELLCGRRPFTAASTKELFDQIKHREPRPPRTIDEKIPRELERICLKAMSKRVGDRYTTGKDMADELRFAVASLSTAPQAATAGASSSPTQLAEPLPDTPTGVGEATLGDSGERMLAVVPKGLRAFGPEDADFFLALLSGPRDRDGLPEAIRFWKARIDSTQPHDAFAVGLIYGPSGCGKTSLVKAGLLPRLAKTVVPIYVEATREDTEARLGRALRNVCPRLNENSTLADTMAALRRGVLSDKHKVLIVLDQFEQWLHARGQELQTSELVAALRQADGEQVQCLLMVRDDFWAATNRLFRNLEIGMVEDRNVRLVDLFDQQHARRVLELFGSAYGRLPRQPAELTPDQEKFLDRAVSELSQNGFVVPVRLSLFADLMKGRPWTEASLAQVGGTKGVGVKFLEETFTARTAVPEHRAVAKPARALLQSLLPEHGTNIKGQMRSQRELAACCGLSEGSPHFERLLEILDRELHIITPAEPEQTDKPESLRSEEDRPEGYFQLTHDYLVLPLREWLTHEQRRSWRGRAALRLAERSGLWNNRPEARHLPTFGEWANILCLTTRKDWIPAERKMMRTATRVHVLRGGIATILLAAVTLAGSVVQRQVADYLHRSEADALIDRLIMADTSQVRGIIGELNAYRPWTDETLSLIAQRSSHSKERLHARLALLPVDYDQVEGLIEDLLNSTPQELLVIRDALLPHKEQITARLWHEVEDADADQHRRFRAACALAAFDPDDPRWTQAGPAIVSRLVAESPIFLGQWLEALRPVSDALLEPFAQVFRNKQKAAERSIAASILAKYAEDEPETLADLILDADAHQYAVLWPALQRHPERAIELMEQELNKTPSPEWKDSPIDPAWSSPDPELLAQIETAKGMLTERFALCQTMPLDQFVEVAENLSISGYRPIRFRPYRTGSALQVAAVWTRDGRTWHLVHGVSADQVMAEDERRRREGYWPIDVAGYLADTADGTQNEQYAALWTKAEPGVADAQMYVGLSGEAKHASAQDTLSRDGYLPQTLQVILGSDRQVRCSSVWWKPDTSQPDAWSSLSGPGLGVLPTSELLQVDVSLCQETVSCSVHHYGTLAHESFESLTCIDLDPAAQAERCREMAGSGYRPVALAVASIGQPQTLRTASIWHRPIISDGVKEAIAKRQANAAVTLVRLGHSERVWPLQAHSANPRLRTRLTQLWATLEVEPEILVDRLASEAEVSTRRALVLSLGEFAKDRLPLTVVQPLVGRLLESYRNNPDPGFHCAVEWLLRQWGLEQEIQRIDQELVSTQPIGSRQWYVNSERHTLAVVTGPVKFWMGSPVHEFGRDSWERQHLRRIHRSFALASKEVTVEQFRRFWQSHFRAEDLYLSSARRYSPDEKSPILFVTWPEAAMYCRWLSELEDIPEEEMCFPPVREIAQAIQESRPIDLPSDYLSRTGYRLPTEAEWEYASRAECQIARAYGSSSEMLPLYAWCLTNANDRAWPVGRLKPNDLGLFDMYGNAWEWCFDRFQKYPFFPGRVAEDKEDEPRVELDKPRVLRGGAFDSARLHQLRSAFRWKQGPLERPANMTGFRVARTIREPLVEAQQQPAGDPRENANRN